MRSEDVVPIYTCPATPAMMKSIFAALRTTRRWDTIRLPRAVPVMIRFILNQAFVIVLMAVLVTMSYMRI